MLQGFSRAADPNTARSTERGIMASRSVPPALFVGVLVLVAFCTSACQDRDQAKPPSKTPSELLAPVGAFRDVGALVLQPVLEISSGTVPNPWRLSKPRAVFEDGVGAIYVLDSDWKRVSVHSPDGSLRRTFGGHGMFEGEFLLPLGMVGSGDNLAILDYELQRISLFSLAGTHVRDLELDVFQPFHLVAFGQEFWVRSLQPRDSVAFVVDSLGRVVRRAVHIDPELKTYIDLSLGGIFIPSAKSIYYVPPHGSHLIKVQAREGATAIQLHDYPAILDLSGVEGRQRLPNVRVSSGVSLGADSLLLLKSVVEVDHAARGGAVSERQFLQFVDIQGATIRTAEVELSPGDMIFSLAPGIEPMSFFLAIGGPQARVVKFSILAPEVGNELL